MSMTEQIIRQYAEMATRMPADSASSQTAPSYHMLADAIYWPDEIPTDLDDFSENCLRFILRYRTTLILEKPEEKWGKYWDEANRQFPQWIGFSESRTTPTESLKDVYRTLSNAADEATYQ